MQARRPIDPRTFEHMAKNLTLRLRRNSNRDAGRGGPVKAEDARWQAVQPRDKRENGNFVYAVRSTGIYCKPSCPSRKPGREQVVFFLLPAVAEQKGFRACKRCKPQLARVQDRRTDAVAQVCREIDRQVQNGDALANSGKRTDFHLTLPALSAGAGMSAHQLERAFRSVMGISPR